MKITHYFTGEAKWAKVHKPDEKYKKYSIDVLLDMKQYKAMKDLGLKNGGKPDDSGAMWVTFRRNEEDGAPDVVDASGSPLSDSIGNGSRVTIKLEVESFNSTKFGKITRSTILGIKVDDLKIYDPEKREEINKPSTGGALSSTDAPPNPRPRIPF